VGRVRIHGRLFIVGRACYRGCKDVYSTLTQLTRCTLGSQFPNKALSLSLSLARARPRDASVGICKLAASARARALSLSLYLSISHARALSLIINIIQECRPPSTVHKSERGSAPADPCWRKPSKSRTRHRKALFTLEIVLYIPGEILRRHEHAFNIQHSRACLRVGVGVGAGV